jgi:hypothetical protein
MLFSGHAGFNDRAVRIMEKRNVRRAKLRVYRELRVIRECLHAKRGLRRFASYQR